jgi:hypothetical protein
MRRHLLVLMVITLLVRGAMMISYPLSGRDDNQSAQNYLISELLQGNLLIGNLRFQTGYPFFIAPVVAFAQNFDRFDDRILLLVQIGISATLPFMVYDIVRRQRSAQSTHAEREAFIVALFVLLDPFGWQWAHFYLPEWLIAFCLVFGLWLLERTHWSLRGALAAGIVLGCTSLMRVNVIPIIGILCVLMLLRQEYAIRHRITAFLAVGAASAAIFLLYIILIHIPSTGTTRISCIGGINLVYSNNIKGLYANAANGANTARYLDLIAMGTPKEVTFFAETYPRWQNPGIWATPAEEAAFWDADAPHPHPGTDYGLLYYIGLCETDDLLRAVFFETLATNPLQYLRETLRFTVHTLVQVPLDVGIDAPPLVLPGYETIQFNGGGTLGFTQAFGEYYTGQWVWQPGIWLYTTTFSAWNLVKWLTLPALAWALFSLRWLYATTALLLLATALSLSAVSGTEPRVYASVYPLWGLLIGGMVAALFERLRRRRS